MQICQDPTKGLTQSSLEKIKQDDESSFIEDWFGSTTNMLISVASVCVVSAVAYRYRIKKLWKKIMIT